MIRPIAVFDSGVGGISALKQLEKAMPAEDFAYYADNLNAPYGTKSGEEIEFLASRAMDKMAAASPKAVVVACNTVTEVCIDKLRAAYPDLPVFGLQPAVKPAPKNTLVLVTRATSESRGFNDFVIRYKGAYVFALDEAAGLIEKDVSDEELTDYIKSALTGVDKSKFASAVLGCTHYALRRECFAKALGLPLYDGNEGLARHVKEALGVKKLLTRGSQKGGVSFFLSDCSTKEFTKYVGIFNRYRPAD